MTETLRKCTLVSNIMTGKHEGLHVHFEDFADLIKDECLDAESWQEKNAELMALETTFDIYMEAHPNASPEVKMLVTKVIDFIRRMRSISTSITRQCDINSITAISRRPSHAVCRLWLKFQPN